MAEDPFRARGRFHQPDGDGQGHLRHPMNGFSLHRLWAVVLKEFIQMKRDRFTFALMVGIPLMQLTLFGFAINSDPKHLPAALRSADQGPFARTFVHALRESGYFTLVTEAA